MNQLPIRTTVEDIEKICAYLQKKPIGATLKEAKSVIDVKFLDGRKITAYKFWGIIEDQERLKLTELGRKIAKDDGIHRAECMRQIIRNIEPYKAIIEKAFYNKEESINSTDVAVHWNDHFKEVASLSEKVLNDQAICFFHIAQGADIGELIVGRKGSPTRLDINEGSIKDFIEGSYNNSTISISDQKSTEEGRALEIERTKQDKVSSTDQSLGKAIFIGHGKNKKPLEQLKKMLDKFKISYKIAEDEPNLGRPIGKKVAEIMRQCNCAVLIFTADEEFTNTNGETIYRPSENVIYELGASSFLYGNRVVIMKEENVEFPSNFKDLGYISFSKDQLESKTGDIIQELVGFDIIKIIT